MKYKISVCTFLTFTCLASLTLAEVNSSKLKLGSQKINDNCEVIVEKENYQAGEGKSKITNEALGIRINFARNLEKNYSKEYVLVLVDDKIQKVIDDNSADCPLNSQKVTEDEEFIDIQKECGGGMWSEPMHIISHIIIDKKTQRVVFGAVKARSAYCLTRGCGNTDIMGIPFFRTTGPIKSVTDDFACYVKDDLRIYQKIKKSFGPSLLFSANDKKPVIQEIDGYIASQIKNSSGSDNAPRTR